MFFPSLSWQNDDILHSNGAKMAFLYRSIAAAPPQRPAENTPPSFVSTFPIFVLSLPW
jgi:hypothetical protein